MKWIVPTLLAGLSIVTSLHCTKSNKGEELTVKQDCFKGKLVKKGLCMNYTISVVEGAIDNSLIEAAWTDPNTGTIYNKAFALGSQCTFPTNIEEGAEFYFKIDSTQNRGCGVCEAFYPTPAKAIYIQVLDGPCSTGKPVQ